jgi:hypothetical protein
METIQVKQLLKVFNTKYEGLISLGLRVRAIYESEDIIEGSHMNLASMGDFEEVKNKVIDPLKTVIHLERPFLFDTSLVPRVFMRVAVHTTCIPATVPEVFDFGSNCLYLTDPDEYASYVMENLDALL